jgi:protein phosphatase 1L
MQAHQPPAVCSRNDDRHNSVAVAARQPPTPAASPCPRGHHPTGKANPLTSDHRASREDERRRIESQGGFVVDCRGTWRVQGSLAVSRGIGDGHLKPWVLAEPDTTTLPVDADCEFLVLASDGLWDKVDAQEAVDVARPLCCTGGQQLSAACSRLVELAASRGSTDDITVLIVSLSAMSDDLYI